MMILMALYLTGCDRAKPSSYRISKEDRRVTTPVPKASGEQSSTSGESMPVLPGMKEAADAAGGLRYSVPEKWETLEPSGIRKVNLKVSDKNGAAELTVLVFPGQVGGALANINRWCTQVGLDPIATEDLPAFTESCTISNHQGIYVRLESSPQSILGALLPFHGYTWFFKLKGDTGTVLANEDSMKRFLRSVRLEDNHH